MYHNDLVFCKVILVTEEEEKLDDMDIELATDDSSIDEGFTWDQLLVDNGHINDER